MKQVKFFYGPVRVVEGEINAWLKAHASEFLGEPAIEFRMNEDGFMVMVVYQLKRSVQS